MIERLVNLAVHHRFRLIPPQPPKLVPELSVREQAGIPPKANFYSSAVSGNSPFEFLFFDISLHNPTSWQWSFGDGTSSVLKNPRHTYVVAGFYTVTLKVSNAFGSDIVSKKVSVAMIADFVGDPLSGNAPLEVSFTDLTSGHPTMWQWDFENNATVDSTVQNPTHTYTDAGLYTVKLLASNSNASDSEIKIEYIEVISGGGGTCELTFYDWQPYDPFAPSTYWDVNVDGTLDAPALERNIETGNIDDRVCFYAFAASEGVKRTFRLIYHNGSNGRLKIQMYQFEPAFRSEFFSLTETTDSTSIHINFEGEVTFILDANWINDNVENTQTWVECVQVVDNDWTGEGSWTVIYD